jgi:N-acylglucosamine-6-phosphate 2-epimerase
MNAKLLHRLQHGLIVSCQALPGSAMDRTDIVLAMARAAVDGGAAALRLEGVENVRTLAAHLVQAGADIIAFDATERSRPVPVTDLLQTVRAAGRLAMADCDGMADALAAWREGCDLVGTTVSGYTKETATLSEHITGWFTEAMRSKA